MFQCIQFVNVVPFCRIIMSQYLVIINMTVVIDGWTTADLVFLWKEGDPVQVVKNLHLPRFTLEKFLTDYCNSKTNTGNERFKFNFNKSL